MAANPPPVRDGTTAAAVPGSPLIDPVPLAELLASDRPPVVLDVRWTLAGPDVESFRAGHLPGAVFVDLDRELAAPPDIASGGGRHPLPEPAVIDALLRRTGVEPGSTVVVAGQRDASVVARAWWLLRWAGHADVRVLDGGFEAWQAAGLPVQIGDGVHRGAGTARALPGAMSTVDADGAAALGAAPLGALLDARAPERYRGETEPVDPVPGHIPGAVSLPLAAVHRPDGRLAEAAELRRIFDGVGVRAGTVAAASCGSGVTACALILAGEVAGIRLALYPGSYSGWCALGRSVQAG